MLLQTGGVLSRCGCTELRASCLVRLQVKQRTTSTCLHFIPTLMSCDRHSVRWGQVTLRLHPHYVCVCVLIYGKQMGHLMADHLDKYTHTPQLHTFGGLGDIQLSHGLPTVTVDALITCSISIVLKQAINTGSDSRINSYSLIYN